MTQKLRLWRKGIKLKILYKILAKGAAKAIEDAGFEASVINIEDLNKVRDIVPQGKLAIGSGVNEENIEQYVDLADILIIGTSFKVDHDVSKRVDQRSVEQLIKKIK